MGGGGGAGQGAGSLAAEKHVTAYVEQKVETLATTKTNACNRNDMLTLFKISTAGMLSPESDCSAAACMFVFKSLTS